jgi:hydroxymethylpyrimidine pyrophosphatase-like HAD family hydrolase
LRRAADHLPHLARSLRPRALYTDLDGTLLGPGASLFAAPSGGVTSRTAEAVAALHAAQIDLIPVSGRTESQVREAARLLGAAGFIAELGGVIAFGDRVERTHGSHRGRGTPVEAMFRSGAPGFLMEAYRGRLEPHTPWAHAARRSTILLRGLVDPQEARVTLERSGYGWLDVLDNGVILGTYPGLSVPEVHAYHLAPRGIDKASAVARDLKRRGLRPPEAVAVGDAPSDLALAPHVGAVFIVQNAIVDDGPDNAYVTEGSFGEGFAEVVFGLLGSG